MTATSIIHFLFVFATLLVSGCNSNAILSEQLSCPEDCNCYFFEINWVTDCPKKNLTSISYKKLEQAVYILNMSRNHLTEIKSFPADIKIKTLNLSDNFLTKIQNATFAGLEQLIDLDLSSNLINHVDPGAFADSAGLITLRLQGNPLNHVEGSFLYSKSLANLYLANCKLTNLSSQFFSRIGGLKKLDLSENPINVIEPGLFSLLTSLKHLNLKKCNLRFIPADTFMRTPNISLLRLNNNKLNSDKNDSMKFLEPLIGLKHLDLKYNNMTAIEPEALKYNGQIMSLELIGNPWKCNSYIVDMWKWTTSSNRTLDVLVGFKKSVVKNVRNKKIKRLVCILDPKSSPTKEVNSRKLEKRRASKVHSTWAKYVRNENGNGTVIAERPIRNSNF